MFFVGLVKGLLWLGVVACLSVCFGVFYLCLVLGLFCYLLIVCFGNDCVCDLAACLFIA